MKTRRTINIETTRNGFRHAFTAEIKGTPAPDGTIVTRSRNGSPIRWKV